MGGLHEDRLSEVITRSVSETIENMAFITADQVPCETISPHLKECISVKQHILEPEYATLCLCMSENLGRMLVNTIYAIDGESATDKMVADLTAELLNTISGSVIKRLLAADTPFKLSIPEVMSRYTPPADNSSETCCFLVSGEPLLIHAALAPYAG